MESLDSSQEINLDRDLGIDTEVTSDSPRGRLRSKKVIGGDFSLEAIEARVHLQLIGREISQTNEGGEESTFIATTVPDKGETESSDQPNSNGDEQFIHRELRLHFTKEELVISPIIRSTCISVSRRTGKLGTRGN
jgi:hypothetical protein